LHRLLQTPLPPPRASRNSSSAVNSNKTKKKNMQLRARFRFRFFSCLVGFFTCFRGWRGMEERPFDG
jgi:hypothetical protein